MLTPPGMKVNIYIKNVDSEDYYLEEIDYTLGPGEEINMMNEELDNYYTDSQAVKRCIKELTDATIYKGLNSVPPKLEWRREISQEN